MNLGYTCTGMKKGCLNEFIQTPFDSSTVCNMTGLVSQGLFQSIVHPGIVSKAHLVVITKIRFTMVVL